MDPNRQLPQSRGTSELYSVTIPRSKTQPWLKLTRKACTPTCMAISSSKSSRSLRGKMSSFPMSIMVTKTIRCIKCLTRATILERSFVSETLSTISNLTSRRCAGNRLNWATSANMRVIWGTSEHLSFQIGRFTWLGDALTWPQLQAKLSTP